MEKYEHDWLENMYQVHAYMWHTQLHKSLSREEFEAEYKEDIYAEACRQGVV